MDNRYDELRRGTEDVKKENQELRNLFTALHQRVAGLERRVGDLGNGLQTLEEAVAELFGRRESH